MTIPHKSRRSDDLLLRPAQTPLADAIAVGAAASGLVIGTMQVAQALEPSEPEASPPHVPEIAITPITTASQPAAAPPTAETTPPAAQIDLALLQPQTPLDPIQPAQPPDIVQALAAEIGTNVGKVFEAAASGMDADTASQQLAADIVQSAQAIVEKLNLDSAAPHVSSVPAAPALVETVLTQTSHIAGDVLDSVSTLTADLATLPAEILGGVSESLGTLASLPSSLLGNDGPDDSGGLLSEIFYPDGGSDTGLAIPDLSTAATAPLVDTVSSLTGLLGLSYSEHADSHGLNALSLL